MSEHTKRISHGGYVRAMREKEGISQAALARKIGVNQSTLSKWELGQMPVGSQYHDALKKALPRLSVHTLNAKLAEEGALKLQISQTEGLRRQIGLVLIESEPFLSEEALLRVADILERDAFSNRQKAKLASESSEERARQEKEAAEAAAAQEKADRISSNGEAKAARIALEKKDAAMRAAASKVKAETESLLEGAPEAAKAKLRNIQAEIDKILGGEAPAAEDAPLAVAVPAPEGKS